MVESQRQRENLECNRREATCPIQESLNKIINRFLIRNFRDQKAMGEYTQNSIRRGGGGPTPCPRPGAMAGRTYLTPETKGSSQEEQPHFQGAVAAGEGGPRGAIPR